MDLWNSILLHSPQRYTSGAVGSSARVLDPEFRRSWAWKQGIIVEPDLSSAKRFKSETSLVRYSLKFSITPRALNGQASAPQNNEEFIPVHSDPEDAAVRRLLASPCSDVILKVKNSGSLHRLFEGEFVENSNRLLYRQMFVIRSYEVGADKTTDITTIISFFQVSSTL